MHEVFEPLDPVDAQAPAEETTNPVDARRPMPPIPKRIRTVSSSWWWRTGGPAKPGRNPVPARLRASKTTRIRRPQEREQSGHKQESADAFPGATSPVAAGVVDTAIPSFPEGSVPSLASRMMPPLLTALGYRHRFASPQATAKLVAARRLRPRAYGPPRLLPRGLDIEVDEDGGWPLYEVRASAGPAQRRIVYLHGGAWINQISPLHWQLILRLAADTGSRVLVPIYPLAPQGTAASVVPQVADLLRRLAATHGAGNVSVVGDSAGGQIALSAALLLRDLGVALAHTVLISPALDLGLRNPAIDVLEAQEKWLVRPGLRAAADLWRDGLRWEDPIVSPLFGQMAGLGPLTVFAGTRDITHPDCELLVSRARAAGVHTEFHQATGMVHVYPLLPIPEGRAARRTMARILGEQH